MVHRVPEVFIAKENLVKGQYYRGQCRNAKVAVWDGYNFWYMRTKWNMVFPEAIHASEDDQVYDVFYAFEPVDPTPEEVVDIITNPEVKP